MYSFLFLGHTSLNYVYAEHRHRELLAEAEHERRVAQNRASPLKRGSGISVVTAGLQALLRVRTWVADSETRSSDCDRSTDRLGGGAAPPAAGDRRVASHPCGSH
jgi:hypothetical protein